MTFIEFGLSYLASWLANATDRARLYEKGAAQPPEQVHSIFPADIAEETRKPRFNTFDAWNDLAALLKTVREPVISILIEDQPSTAYRLPSMVLESLVTREWYVFHRGRMSFEGSGGGMRNAKDILVQVKTAGAAVGVWIVPQNVLDDLDNGYVLWPAVRDEAIPLLSRVASEHSWAEIERNVAENM